MSRSSRRERVKLRKGYLKHRKKHCEKCKTTNSHSGGFYVVERKILTIHHIDSNRHNSNPNNLQTLCRMCHDKIHDIKKKTEMKRMEQWCGYKVGWWDNSKEPRKKSKFKWS